MCSAAASSALSDALRERSDDELATLLHARPDLMTPLPSTVEQLAARALTRSSTARALDRLDRLALAVIEGLVILGSPASSTALGELLGLDESDLRPALDHVRALALVWGSPDALYVPPVAADLLGPHVAGLGSPSDDPALTDPTEVAARLEAAGPDARAVAERLAAGPPVGRLSNADRPVTVETARSPVEKLLAHRLLTVVDARTVALPREVGLYLRGGRLFPPDALTPPALTGPVREKALVDRTAAGTTLDVVRRVEQLLDTWAAHPPGVLRSGGVGVRDLRRAAALLDVDESVAAALLECAFAAGLVATGEDGAVWLPTPAFDLWLASDLAQRWASLAHAWLRSTRVAALVGTRDDRDRPIAALSAGVERPVAPEVRRLTLTALAAAPPGTAPDVDAVVARVRWLRPRRMTSLVERLVTWTIDEAAVLGVTGLGALATHGAALVRGEAEAAEALAPLLPEPVDHVLLQADLTAVAPGPLRPELARSLAAMADVESHGGATVYRFSAASIQRALDAGHTAAELHDILARHSATPVPQPLSYLVDDVARKHGRLRAGTMTAYLRCDDPPSLDALMADRRVGHLGLRRIAPTVLVSRLPVRVLVDELRALGYTPVPETPDGALILSEARAGRTAETPTRETATSRPEPDPDVVAAAVRALRAGDRARASRPAGFDMQRRRRTGTAETVEVLRDAVEGGYSVWVGYVDEQGGTRDRIVDPIRIEGGWLTAYDHTVGETRAFALHRIMGVAPVDTAD
jgi:hypothetical protein